MRLTALTTIIFIIFIIVSCSNNNNNLSKEWANDSIGCLHIRNKDLALELIKKNHLEQGSTYEFKGVFGKPNFQESDPFTTRLIYIEKSVCEDGDTSQNADKCYIILEFNLGKYSDLSEVCE
jgi:hypothetical protein